MNALKKLLAPHTIPENDRPSLVSINAIKDLITAKLRDSKPLKEFMPELEKLRRGTHENKKLLEAWMRLGNDKMEAIKFLLDDKKLIKYIHGPPGTGKSYLALAIAIFALMFPPPTTGADDEWDRPVDLGPQVEPEEYDKVDLNAAPQRVQLTDEQKAALPQGPQTTKILFISGQNTAVDDLVLRFLPMWKAMGGTKVAGRRPVVLRLNSWQSESRDFVRRYANVGRYIQRTTEDAVGGILMSLLNAFSDKADELDREGRRSRSSNPSIVDQAVELFNADTKKPKEQQKYQALAILVGKLEARPEQIYALGKQVSNLVEEGPMKGALAQADVVFGTPVGAADRAFRQVFRPHFIISDESPRNKEITFLILLAHYTPRAYFCFGDYKQLSPVILSKHQHRKYKPPRSFKKANDDQPTGVELAGGNEPGQDEAPNEDETKNGPVDY